MNKNEDYEPGDDDESGWQRGVKKPDEPIIKPGREREQVEDAGFSRTAMN